MKYLSFLFPLFLISITSPGQGNTTSSLEVMDILSGQIITIKEFPFIIEAPFWTKDGKDLIYNSGGKLFRINIRTGNAEIIPSGAAQNCNNDHVLSPDGMLIGISDQSESDGKSRISIIPLLGGEPRLITPLGPSYLHGWSPDGKTLAYCADRNGNFDVYTISVDGGEETRLTTSAGLDDGPEYSPDGQFIWFNSSVKGDMQIWKMKPDGSEKTQMTSLKDEYAWFPHISPDGKWVVFLTYRKGDVGAEEHLANKNVILRIMSPDGKNIRTLTRLFGGQGTMNVNSWSPDSRKIAFVKYKVSN